MAKRCVVVFCDSLEEVLAARTEWEAPPNSFTLLDCNPLDRFVTARAYEQTSTGSTLVLSRMNQFALYFTRD